MSGGWPKGCAAAAAQAQHKCKRGNPCSVLQGKRRDQCKVATPERHASVDWGAFLALTCVTAIPTRSAVTGLPRSTEKARSTQGRYGAVKGKSPKKDMRWCGFSLRKKHRQTHARGGQEK